MLTCFALDASRRPFEMLTEAGERVYIQPI